LLVAWASGFVTKRSLGILQVSTSDIAGGAEKVAWNLFQSCRGRGHNSWLAVGRKRSDDPDVLLIPNEEVKGRWYRFWSVMNSHFQSLDGRMRGAWAFSCLARGLAEPGRFLDECRGIEDFHFPGTWRLLGLSRLRPNIIHCHNLHGGYFDLRVLPWLSQQVPVILTLHDAWLFSGHCAHSFECERWKTGCGQCPDLSIYPAVRRDATDHNWRRKKSIFARSRLYISAPSQWLMRKVEQSILAPAVVDARVIPNGVDLSVFHPADKPAARLALGIPRDVRVLLYTANSIRYNIWKDYQTLTTAVTQLAECLRGPRILLIALGEKAPAQRIGQSEVRFIPYQKDPKVVAGYYQASDVFVHAARVDTFPNTVLEALACGTPVVATAVGGIAEQVKGLEIARRLQIASLNQYGPNEATGALVPEKDANGMAVCIEQMLTDDALRSRIGKNAARDAQKRFDLERQVTEFLKWYELLLRNFATHEKFTALAS
jgi:glycosyltransferase involved in cell wall biosynthesis